VPGPARPRPQLGGVAAAARELVGSGAPTERESCGIVYSIAVSGSHRHHDHPAHRAQLEHDLWPRMIDTEAARGAVEEAIRFGNPFPHSSRFVGEPFTSGDLQLQPGDQVLL
jgi:hypothetical protein